MRLTLSIFCCLFHFNFLLANLNTQQEFALLLPLDKQTEEFLNEQKLNSPRPMYLKDIPLYLLRMQEINRPPIPKLAGIRSIERLAIQGKQGAIPLRIYIPDNVAKKPLPVLVYFHGGGWALGTLDEYDLLCQYFALHGQCIVVAVDYHLAPEYPFPIPLEDCYAATQWVEKSIQQFGGDPKRLAVGGDSAGGNLASGVTLMARDQQGPKIAYQILLFPALCNQFNTLSYTLFEEGYLLSKEDMKFFWSCYLKQQDIQSHYASPLLSQSVANLPPTFLMIAEYDVLRDEGLAYGWRLQQSGVPLDLKKYGSIHGFIGFSKLDIAQQAIQDVAKALRIALNQDQ